MNIPPTIRRELVPLLEHYEIPTSRTLHQVVDRVAFPSADMTVTYYLTVEFQFYDEYIEACVEAGAYGTLFEW